MQHRQWARTQCHPYSSVPYLCVATKLSTADAISKRLGTWSDDAPPNLTGDLKEVLEKTALTDWAFRWHIDMRSFRQVNEFTRNCFGTDLLLLGIDQISAMGGSGGYADNVYTRRTYMRTGKGSKGLFSSFKQGGNYKRAMGMIPRGSTVFLCGEVKPDVLLATLASVVPAKGRTTESIRSVEAIIAASDGVAGIFVLDLLPFWKPPWWTHEQRMPIGVVIGLNPKAAKTIRLLVPPTDEKYLKLWGQKIERYYRGVEINRLRSNSLIAIMEDRAILSFKGVEPLRAAIDTALDGNGGFAYGSEGNHLIRLAREGAGAFGMEMGVLARYFWPIMKETVYTFSPFDFESMPSTYKLASMLGPEVAVFQPDDRGLLLKSSGKIPLSTKIGAIILYSFLRYAVLD